MSANRGFNSGFNAVRIPAVISSSETGVDDVPRSQPSLLPVADIDDGNSKTRGFPDAAGRIAEHQIRVRQQAVVAHLPEAFEKMRGAVARGELTQPHEDRLPADVGVRHRDDQRGVEFFERAQQRGNFRAGIDGAESRWMMRDNDNRRPQLNPEAF